MNFFEIFCYNFCLFSHDFEPILMNVHVTHLASNFWFSIFLIFFFYSIYCFLMEETLLSCEKNRDFYVNMLIMMWNAQKSGSKNVRCVCVSMYVRNRRRKKYFFSSKTQPNNKLVFFTWEIFFYKFQFQMYWIFVYKTTTIIQASYINWPRQLYKKDSKRL